MVYGMWCMVYGMWCVVCCGWQYRGINEASEPLNQLADELMTMMIVRDRDDDDAGMRDNINTINYIMALPVCPDKK